MCPNIAENSNIASRLKFQNTKTGKSVKKASLINKQIRSFILNYAEINVSQAFLFIAFLMALFKTTFIC
jgi:hypothetical protein